MLHKTRGIVLNYLKYKDSSIIVRIFTREFGLTSYLVNGVRSARSKGKIALYQPLSLLDLVVYNKESINIQRISDARLQIAFKTIPFNPVKSGVAMFLTEFFLKILKQGYANDELFDFLEYGICAFDEKEKEYANFHLQVLLKTSFYLGFYPENARTLLDDTGTYSSSGDGDYQLIHFLMENPLLSNTKTNRATRNNCLKHLLAYYEVHMDSLGKWKSLEIIQSLLNV